LNIKKAITRWIYRHQRKYIVYTIL